MNLEERKKAFVVLGEVLAEKLNTLENSHGEDGISAAIVNAHQKNQWFTKSSTLLSFKALVSWLKRESLEEWLIPYSAKISAVQPKHKIGVIMAGNIPMVGFHDMLCVLLSGNTIQAKCAADDGVLIPFICEQLIHIEPRFKEMIQFVPRLEKQDAVIATGGNNSARYFEYYFGKQPHIIRKNRNAVAVFNGNETTVELIELGKDIFTYYGLGCRNVSKLYIPKNYDFGNFFKAMENEAIVMQHNKYMNNYDYHHSLFLLNNEKFLTNNFLILRESKHLATPVSVVHYEYFNDKDDLENLLKGEKENIQCIIGNGYIPFGKSQSPALNDYADGVDVMQFLINLK